MSFKSNYERICFEKHLKPSAVCEAIGLARSTYSLWTDESVPRRSTLDKLSSYLGVTPDELLSESSSVPHFDLQRFASPALTPAEQNLLEAYRSDASLRSAIDAMLEATGHGLNGKKPASSDA